MKKLALLLIFILTIFQGFSQTKGISYQAVILNPEAQEIPGVNVQGNILSNTTVGIQFTIIDASGNEEYQESHTTSTDKYGMLNLLIGTGNPSSSANFLEILWDGTTKKLKVAIDFSGGSNYSPLSEQNLSYMPQPPTEQVSIAIETNTEALINEIIRATAAEELNATDLVSEVLRATAAEGVIQSDVDANTAKTGITPAQDAIIAATSGTNTGDQDITGIVTNATAISTLQAEQTTQNTAIALNTAKVSDVNHVASSTTDNLTEGTTNLYYTETRVSANAVVAANTTKTGITSAQAATIAATSGTNTGDQDITGIVTNTNNITTLQTNKITQDASILSNTNTLLLKEDKTNKNVANGYAGLDNNTKIDVAQLPAITINNVYTLTSEAAQLALTALQGDVAIRTDVLKNYINNGGTTGTMADWSELATPGVVVSSVNGKTGNVVVGISDIATLQTSLDAKTNIASLAAIATSGSYSDLTNIPANLDIDKTDDLLTSDLVNDLTTGGSTKVLTAQQGKILKGFVDMNTAKTGVTLSQAATIAATSGTNTGDQDITGIVTNTNNITTLQTNKITQDASILSNTNTLLLKEDKTNKNVANGYAGLDNNTKIDVAQLPAITINNVYTLTSEASQLALTASQGDVAIRTDVLKNYINNGGTTGTMADWSELATPGVVVSSVNGKTGNVVVGISDIATLQTSLDAKTNIASLAAIATSGSYSDLTNIPANLDIDKTDDLLTSDLVNDLTTGGSTKVLTAQQGKILKGFVDINTAKAGITPAQAATIAATSGTNTGDQNISGIATNATDVSTLQIGQTTQNTAIALNTAKVSDVNHVASSTTDNLTEGATNLYYTEARVSVNTAVAANTAKAGITPAQAATIAATSGTNTGDQDISGIATNATDISAIQTEQITQNAAIASSTAQTVPVPANLIQVSFSGVLSPTNAAPVSFTQTLFSKGSDLSLQVNGTVAGLKAGRTYKITAHISGKGTATSGLALYNIYDYTSNAIIGKSLEFIANSYGYTYSQKPSGISYITPTVDTAIGLRAAGSGTSYNIGNYTTFTVEEVIDRNSLIAQDYVAGEQITNRKWIDGKPIYRYVGDTSASSTIFAAGIVDNLLLIGGHSYQSNGAQLPINFYETAANKSFVYMTSGGTVVHFRGTSIMGGIVILEYTKL